MIAGLTVSNFKCFESERVPMRALSLLAGLNSAGKSTIIQALLLLRQSRLAGQLPESLGLNGPLAQVGTAQDALYSAAQQDEIGFGLEWVGGACGEWRFQYDREADTLRALGDAPGPRVYERSPFKPGFHYLGAERLAPRVANVMADHEVRELRSMGPQGEYAAHYVAMFGDEIVELPGLMHTHEPSHKLQHQVEAWLQTVSPGISLDFTSHPSLDFVQSRFAFPGGDQVIPASYRSTNIGFGVTYVLPILVALLSSRPDHLVVMENPEAHLHPRGQTTIGMLLARAAHAGVQVIVETHSEHVLNGIRIAVHQDEIAADKVQILYFERREGARYAHCAVYAPQMDQRGRIDDWPEGFFDEHERALAQLLGPPGGGQCTSV